MNSILEFAFGEIDENDPLSDDYLIDFPINL